MTKNTPFQCYCHVFGTNVDSAEVSFYDSKNTPFINTEAIKDTAKKVSFLKSGEETADTIEDMASFTGMPCDPTLGTLYCFTQRRMHTGVNRSSSYGQTLICRQEDVCEGESFIEKVLGFHFLSEKQILENNLCKEDVEQWDAISPADLKGLSEERRNSLCLTADLLLQGKKVMLRLPEGKAYMNLCKRVMVELFTLLPEVTRPKVSFSTCRSESDFSQAGRIQLLIVDKTVQCNGQYTLVKLDAPEKESSDCMKKWSTESRENRNQLNNIFLNWNSSPTACYADLQKYYDPQAWWWAKELPEKRLMSYEDILSELNNNAALWTKENWEAFCKRIPSLLQYEGGVQELLLDSYIKWKDQGDDLLELAGRSEQGNGFYSAGLSEGEFKEVQKAGMITKQTLERLDKLQENYERSIKDQKQQFDNALSEQKQQMDAALSDQQRTYVFAIEQQSKTIEQLRQEQLEALKAQQRSQEEKEQKEETTRRQDREELRQSLAELEVTIRNSNQNLAGQMDDLSRNFNGQIAKVNHGVEEVNERVETINRQTVDRLNRTIDDAQAQQQSRLKEFQEKMNDRLTELEEKVAQNASNQDKRNKAVDKKLQGIKQAERSNGNAAPFVLSIAGCALGVVILVLLVIWFVQYMPTMKNAKAEYEASPTPEIITPAPTDTPASTVTPAPSPVPYALGKYIVVCNQYMLTLTEEDEEHWVYENDLVQVVIRTRAEMEETAKEELLTTDGKYILMVSRLLENEEASALQQALTEFFSQMSKATVPTPTPELEPGSVNWVRQMLHIRDDVVISREIEVAEELKPLLDEKFDPESMYLYGLGKVYLLLCKDNTLFELATETGMGCRRIMIVQEGTYTLYIFAEDDPAVEALFLIMEGGEGEAIISTASPTVYPSASAAFPTLLPLPSSTNSTMQPSMPTATPTVHPTVFPAEPDTEA